MKKNKAILFLTLALSLFLPPGGEVFACSKKVHVSRDEYGAFSITGKNIHSVFEMMGYCVAQDRLWQMELYRRSAAGRLAEIFGPSQLPSDVFVRTTGYSAEELEQGFEGLDRNSRMIIQAYVDGINKRIQEISEDPSLLPFEFCALSQALGIQFFPEPWKVSDILAWASLLLRQFDGEAMSSGQLDNATLLQELAEKYPSEYLAMVSDLRWINDPEAQTMVPGNTKNGRRFPIRDPKFMKRFQRAAKKFHHNRKNIIERLKKINAYVKGGSYAWVVSGKKTRSGKPILYSGPQMDFSVPAICLEGTLKAPGFQVSGMTIPGIPGIIIGRTPYHAWSMQVGHAHTVDYYVEDPSSVQLNRFETIKVAGSEDITIPIFRTVHGPVINPMPFDPSQPADIIISWKYSHWGKEFDLIPAVFGLGKVKTMKQFGEVANKMPVSLHLCYADRFGNIAYWMSGKDPVRPEGIDTRFPLLGDGSQEWVPDAYKPVPHIHNPKQGYIGGWNNKASADCVNSNILDSDGKYFYGPFQRAHVIEEYLSRHKKLTFQQVIDLAEHISLTDSFGLGGNTWTFVKDYFSSAVLNNPTPQRLEALELLENWNGCFTGCGESVRMDAWVLQNEWITEVLRLVFEDELLTRTLTWKDQSSALLFNVLLHQLKGDASGVVNQYNWFKDQSGSGKPEIPDDLFVLALDTVLDKLGPCPWNVPRGDIVFKHDLLGVLGKTAFASRSTYAQCVKMGRFGPSKIKTTFPLGQSGNILLDPSSGQPVFDENFFSMQPLFDSFGYRDYPLFFPWNKDRD